MDDPATAQVDRRALGGAVCLVLGLALGFLCRIPLWAGYLTVRVIGQEAGWAYFDATFDEGVGLTAGVAVAVWVLYALFAGTLTVLAQQWARIRARTWWSATAVLWLLPFAVLDLPQLP